MTSGVRAGGRVSAERGWIIGMVCAAAMGVCASPDIALADARVTALDGTEWPATVAALQADTGSQGRVLALCVRDDRTAQCLPCGSYSLAFDEFGAQAFRYEQCDPRTGASSVRLVDRSALFDHGHAVPRPRAITVRASIVSAIETSGGAASTGGSALGCTARIRPYLRDLEHGTDVYLSPDDYDVRVLHAGVDVTALGNGWMLASEMRIDSEVDYEVIERSSGESVMNGHAALECASQTVTTIDTGGIVFDGAPQSGLPTIQNDSFGSLATMTGEAGGPSYGGDLSYGCIGYYPSTPQYEIDVEAPSARIELWAESDRDLTLAIRTADGNWHCNDDGGRYPHSLDPIVNLEGAARGVTQIFVGTYSAGQVGASFRLHVTEPGVVPPDVAAATAARGPSHRPLGGLLASGIVVQTINWVFMAAFDAIPEILCTGASSCPNATWRSVAWIPLVGPFFAESLDGAHGNDFSAPALVDAAFQDLGLLFVLLSVAIGQDHHRDGVALGTDPNAPHLALGGGSAGSIGATITF